MTKKRTRRAVKFQRAITGASLAEILAKRNQKPEVRKAQREQAIRSVIDHFMNYMYGNVCIAVKLDAVHFFFKMWIIYFFCLIACCTD